MKAVTHTKIPRGTEAEFIRRAQRAFRRVARRLRAESKRTGVPLAVWPQKGAAPGKKKG